MNDTISVEKLKALLERRAARDNEIEPLMAKYTDAKMRGLELKDADRKRLLAFTAGCSSGRHRWLHIHLQNMKAFVTTFCAILAAGAVVRKGQ